MDVSSRISAAVSHLAALGSTKSTSEQAGRAESPPPPEGAESGASTQLSRPAQLMHKLAQLRDSAPDQFKQAVSSIASELRNVSEQDSGMGAKLLVDLANKLDQAANEATRSGAEPGPATSLAPTDAGLSASKTSSDRAANAASSEGGAPQAGASRAAVDAYRATADAHVNGPAGQGAFARALQSVDAAGAGGEPRRQ